MKSEFLKMVCTESSTHPDGLVRRPCETESWTRKDFTQTERGRQLFPDENRSETGDGMDPVKRRIRSDRFRIQESERTVSLVPMVKVNSKIQASVGTACSEMQM